MFPTSRHTVTDDIDHIPITTMGNTASRLPPYPAPPSYLDLGSLLALALNEKAWVLAALGNDPLKKAETILQNPAIGRPGLLLSSQELSIAVENVYSKLSSNIEVEERYIVNLVVAIVDRVRIDGEGMTEGIEQVVRLAARMVKGEACGKCYSAEYQSPTRSSIDLARQFVDAIEALDGIATALGVKVFMSSKPKFSIEKLCSIYDHFDQVRHLIDDLNDIEELEEMWCHDGCCASCWDSGDGDLHLKWCMRYPL
jgi:bacterioferritin-associated ferredoxin